MNKKEVPLNIEGVNESIYADFLYRFGAGLLDAIIMVPIVLLIEVINSIDVDFFYFKNLALLVVSFWFSIYLVKRYGGSPGKLIVGIKIIRLDGEEVTWREAVLRESVNFGFLILQILIAVYAFSIADIDFYRQLNWYERDNYLQTFVPVWTLVLSWASGAWYWGEFLVLLLNRRKRAIHDFIAGTVVVKARYLPQIRAALQDDLPPEEQALVQT